MFISISYAAEKLHLFHLPFHWHGRELVKTTLPRTWAVLGDLVFDIGQLLTVCPSLEYVSNSTILLSPTYLCSVISGYSFG